MADTGTNKKSFQFVASTLFAFGVLPWRCRILSFANLKKMISLNKMDV